MKRNKMSLKRFLDQIWPTAPQHEVEAARDRILGRVLEELKKHDTSLRSLYGDGWSAPAVNQREFQVLTAASMLGDRADIDTITDMVEEWVGGTMIGHVHVALSRLEERGLIRARRLEPAEWGGEPQYRLEVTEAGERALRRAKAEGKQLANAQEDEARGQCY